MRQRDDGFYVLDASERAALDEALKDSRTGIPDPRIEEARAPYVVEQNDRMFLLGGVVWYSETYYKQSKAVAHSQGYAQGLEDAAKRIENMMPDFCKGFLSTNELAPAIRALKKTQS